jgi:hypothetical protein
MRWVGIVVVLVSAVVFWPLGCQQAPPEKPDPAEQGPVWFEDVTEKVGLSFVHDAGPVGEYFMPQIMASGCALFDFDRDGRLDIYLLNNAGPGSKSTNRLYRQKKDGTFEDVTRGSGLGIAGYNTGVAIGDVNNDGWPDVLVTQYGGVKLFLNNGNGTFRDVTRDSGLDNPVWAASACFVDINRDGWLDLVVVNYLDYDPGAPCKGMSGQRDYCHPNQFAGRVTKLFRNKGRRTNGKGWEGFEDITLSAGLAAASGPGLGVICADFTGDGWPDIFVANDSRANHLWVNNGKGTHFTEEAVKRGVAYNTLGQPQANMGVALGDVDGDGLDDLFVTHLNDEYHTLWKQGPERGIFRDQTAEAGLANPRWRATGFGTVMADFDNDGALDIAVVNGRVRAEPPADAPHLSPFWRRYAERNQLFWNDGKGKFRDISPANAAFCGKANVARGLVCGDICPSLRGGRPAMDLLVTTVAGPARLYRNVATPKGHWLMARVLLDRAHGQRDAYGAVVQVVAGGQKWTRLVNPGVSYLSSCDPRVHVGLGSAEKVDAVVVTWPDGKREKFAGGATDRRLVLRQGRGPRTELDRGGK